MKLPLHCYKCIATIVAITDAIADVAAISHHIGTASVPYDAFSTYPDLVYILRKTSFSKIHHFTRPCCHNQLKLPIV